MSSAQGLRDAFDPSGTREVTVEQLTDWISSAASFLNKRGLQSKASSLATLIVEYVAVHAAGSRSDHGFCDCRDNDFDTESEIASLDEGSLVQMGIPLGSARALAQFLGDRPAEPAAPPAVSPPRVVVVPALNLEQEAPARPAAPSPPTAPAPSTSEGERPPSARASSPQRTPRGSRRGEVGSHLQLSPRSTQDRHASQAACLLPRRDAQAEGHASCITAIRA